MTYAQPLDSMMNEVAHELLGNPNERLSKTGDGTLRFGSKGAIEVNTQEGWFADYEEDVKGGVLALIMHKGGVRDRAAAFRWLEERGIKDPSNDDAPKPKSVFYDYRDEDGTALFRVERRGKGSAPPFLQHGPDGAGGFRCAKGCMQGVRRVLYRLPELAASPMSAIVFVCEGEKDADRVGNAGLIATTNPGGALKFEAHFAAALAGRRVVVLEDNDETGRKHAADVKAKLEGVADSVAVLRLPGLPAKGDVSDWLAGGGSAYDLSALAEKALAAAGPELLPSLDLAALAKVRARAKEFAIERIAPLGEVTLFTGPGSAGKSLLGQQIATSAAAGLQCLGLNVLAGPALYLTCEDDAEQLHFRQERICEALHVPMEALAGRLHLVSLRGALDNPLGELDERGNFAPSPAYRKLADTIKAVRAKIVVLDNVAHLFTGNENDRGDVTQFVNLLNRLAGETGAAILLLAHPNKSGDSYSGSTAWLNAVRSQVWIDRKRDSDGSEPNPDARVLSIGKANYTAIGDAVSFIWRNWAFVREEDLPPSQAAEYRELSRAHHVDKKFLECLAKASTEKRATSPSRSASNYAPRMFAAMTVGKGVTAREYEGAMERMLHLGTIANDQRIYQRDNRTWATGLGLLESAQTLAQTMHKPVHTGAQSVEREAQETAHSGAQNCTHSPPISKDIPGAATGAAARNEDDLDWSAHGVDDE